MNSNVRDCLVTDYEHLIPNLDLPDLDDRHVLAAAIKCKADSIVTFNLSDFPKRSLRGHGIEAQHPDDFTTTLIDQSEDEVLSAIREQRASLKNPAYTTDEFVQILARQGLRNLVTRLKPLAELI